MVPINKELSFSLSTSFCYGRSVEFVENSPFTLALLIQQVGVSLLREYLQSRGDGLSYFEELVAVIVRPACNNKTIIIIIIIIIIVSIIILTKS